MRLAYLDPVGPEHILPELVTPLLKYLDDDTILDYVHIHQGGPNLEYRYTESLAIPWILKKLQELELEGYNGAVIGCFLDPGLDVAKEVLKTLVVTAPCTSSMHIAMHYGKRVGILAGRQKHVPRLKELLSESGIQEGCYHIDVLGLSVAEMLDDSSTVEDRMLKVSQKLISEEGIDVIVPACTIESGHHEYLQEVLTVPVIDPILAGLKELEYRVTLKKRCNWHVSKASAYESSN